MSLKYNIYDSLDQESLIDSDIETVSYSDSSDIENVNIPLTEQNMLVDSVFLNIETNNEPYTKILKKKKGSKYHTNTEVNNQSKKRENSGLNIGKNSIKKVRSKHCKRIHPKIDTNSINEQRINPKVYDEFLNIPSSIQEAIDKKQNLTLKQILILMNLHSIPAMSINVIHDRIQKTVNRKKIRICYDSRVFNVSYYYWNDLKWIEMLIYGMFEEF